jgi:hypothetical protein
MELAQCESDVLVIAEPASSVVHSLDERVQDLLGSPAGHHNLVWRLARVQQLQHVATSNRRHALRRRREHWNEQWHLVVRSATGVAVRLRKVGATDERVVQL